MADNRQLSLNKKKYFYQKMNKANKKWAINELITLLNALPIFIVLAHYFVKNIFWYDSLLLLISFTFMYLSAFLTEKNVICMVLSIVVIDKKGLHVDCARIYDFVTIFYDIVCPCLLVAVIMFRWINRGNYYLTLWLCSL